MTLLFGVLVASLVGSVHCAAMCGAFVCLYARGSIAARASGHVAYNAGRLVSYVALGLVAGALGARVDRLGALVDVQRAAAIVAGAERARPLAFDRVGRCGGDGGRRSAAQADESSCKKTERADRAPGTERRKVHHEAVD